MREVTRPEAGCSSRNTATRRLIPRHLVQGTRRARPSSRAAPPTGPASAPGPCPCGRRLRLLSAGDAQCHLPVGARQCAHPAAEHSADGPPSAPRPATCGGPPAPAQVTSWPGVLRTPREHRPGRRREEPADWQRAQAGGRPLGAPEPVQSHGTARRRQAVHPVPAPEPVRLGDRFPACPRTVSHDETAEEGDVRRVQPRRQPPGRRKGRGRAPGRPPHRAPPGATAPVQRPPAQRRSEAPAPGRASAAHSAGAGIGSGPGNAVTGPTAKRLPAARPRGPALRRRQMRHAASIQMSANDSSIPIRGRQPRRSRAVRTSACCQAPQPSGYGAAGGWPGAA